MPLLDRDGLRADPWARVAAGDVAAHPFALVAWADAPAALAARRPDQQLGVEIANTADLAAIRPMQDRIALIAIAFPQMSDGRGFSLARQLREAGYAGALRAVGPLIADQFAYALACGFDEVETTQDILARQPVAQWLAARAAIGMAYQRGYAGAGSILDARRAARRAGAPS